MANKKIFYTGNSNEALSREDLQKSFDEKQKKELEFLDGKMPDPVNTEPITTFEPFGRKLLVVVDNQERETSGGILIPMSAGVRQITGCVVGVGHDVLMVKLGDRVLFPHHRGTPITLEGREVLIMDEKDDIVGRIKTQKDEPAKRIVN